MVVARAEVAMAEVATMMAAEVGGTVAVWQQWRCRCRCRCRCWWLVSVSGGLAMVSAVPVVIHHMREEHVSMCGHA